MMGPSKRRRAPGSPILELFVDSTSAVALYRQLYDALREAILAGRLRNGARVPSSRALAADLGIARNTVIEAYDQLRSEGYLVSRRGGGTRVRQTMPDSLIVVKATPSRMTRATRGARPAVLAPTTRATTVANSIARATAVTHPMARATAVAHPMPQRLSRRGSALVESNRLGVWSKGEPVPFQLGVSAIDAFPLQLWAKLESRRLRRGAVALGDADPSGEPALRAAIQSYVSTSRGVRCSQEQVMVLNGTQQALYLIAQVLLDPGDGVWLEEPGYIGARMAFEAAGALLVPVPVDTEGLQVSEGVARAPNARVAYVTPSHQFPLGAVMSARRRLQLLEWARASGAWIVEDDYDSEFRYAGRPLPSLRGLEDQQETAENGSHVLYLGTFSKTLVPGFRLGYMVVPDSLIDAFRAARAATDRHTPTMHQEVLADFIGEGHYARHIRRVRALCAERQGVLIEAAASRLSGRLSLGRDPAGLHLVGTLDGGVNDVAAAEAAVARGVTTAPLSRCYVGEPPPGTGALVLGYAGYNDEALLRGVDRLAQALEGL